MLVLTRKQQQQIHIGEGVTITILKVKGNTVRIGIDAPNDVKIVRAELEPEEESAPVEEASAAEEAEPQSTLSRIDQIESATASAQGKEEYRVLSYRMKPEATESKRNDSPRAASMRDFLAARATNSIG
ncbi:carbon storage regulator [Bremerella alba]|uniref:Translational regulator CsrA n=1 Tax=Bremerella alba TaxID=980252 RepID=A0A7V9A7J8_9BACT|nr:carbon storage regulator [Bremerella alba]MBA2115101.1 Carbon storage regulator [Bremerella alba]